MFKILTHFAHSTYQTALAKIPEIEFYHVEDKSCIWPENKRLKAVWSGSDPQPVNVFGIEAVDVNPADFDLVVIHQHPFIETFSQRWKSLPVIMTEHTWPYCNLPSEVLKWKNVRHDMIDHTIFITPTSREAWDATRDKNASYIYHAIDVDSFPVKTDYTGKNIVTTTNEFISRDWACGFSLWAQVLGLPMSPHFENISLYGYGNDNIGEVAKGSRTHDEILLLLTEAGVYFNPAIMSPIPMSLLEAVAVGVPIVSTSYCEVGNIFKNGEHGIISNDPGELRRGICYMLDNPDDAKRMADNAKNVVKEFFSPTKFVCEWKKVFQKVNSKERFNARRKSYF